MRALVGMYVYAQCEQGITAVYIRCGQGMAFTQDVDRERHGYDMSMQGMAPMHKGCEQEIAYTQRKVRE